MYISEFQLNNYKSYHESAKVRFGPGFNIVVGQNDSGKTALLEAIAMGAKAIPHRSLATLPEPDSPNLSSRSWADVTVTVDRDELRDFIGRHVKGTTWIPAPEVNTRVATTLYCMSSPPVEDLKIVAGF